MAIMAARVKGAWRLELPAVATLLGWAGGWAGG